MKYSSQTLHNPSLIKRFSHRSRIYKAFELVVEANSSSLLDVGSGDCYFPVEIAQQTNIRKIVAFEPANDQLEEARASHGVKLSGVECASSWHEVGDGKFDVITCLEVMEHLPAEQLRELAREVVSRMHDDSLLIISVPIETGISGLIKNIIRAVLKQSHDGASIRTVLRAFLAMEVDRGSTDYLTSHVGFNYSSIEKLFGDQPLLLLRKIYTPLPLGPIFNSQVFYVYARKTVANAA
jgi:2-polyprenyl-3-methyl-5-hydroxy-6-metoxy-1,4-benzoquinol methylase